MELKTVVDLVIAVAGIGTIIYQFLTGKIQQATEIVETVVADLKDGSISAQEKKELAIMIIRQYPVFLIIPDGVLGWVIDQIIAKVNGKVDLANSLLKLVKKN